MITSVALIVLALLLVPAFTPHPSRRTAASRVVHRILPRIAAEIADMNYAARRVRELQTGWPIERRDAAEPPAHSLHLDF